MKRIAGGSDADLAIELWPIDRLTPYPDNPRHCPPGAIAKVAPRSRSSASGRRSWSTGRHRGRRSHPSAGGPAARHEDGAGACRRRPLLRPGSAYRIADNRSNEETSWNADLLSVEISKLVSLDYDIDVLGFDGDELAELLAQPTVGLVDPDEVPEVPAEPLTCPGEKWRLGNHVLLCGDSTKPSDVARLMDGHAPP